MASESYHQHAGTVLYIDDDPNSLKLVQRNLSRMGYHVRTELNPIRGMQLAKYDRPDVIIVDIMMPEISGLDVIYEIKHTPELAHIPVIAVTSDWSEDTRRCSLEAGCDAHLHKPLRRAKLLKIVRQMTQLRAMANV